MGFLGTTELLIIAGVVVMLFGASKLPKLGGAVGESIKNFKKGIKDEPPKIEENKEESEENSNKFFALHKKFADNLLTRLVTKGYRLFLFSNYDF